jgi:DNA-binding MarR family transcriptional regulator
MDLSYKQLDPLIHQPARLSIMAALVAAKEVEYVAIRDAIDISESLLSRYSAQLEQAGYITIRKGFVGKRPRTWFSVTPVGRQVFKHYVDTLQSIVAQ